MKTILMFTSIVLLLISCKEFNESKSIYVDDFNWTIEIPKNFNSISEDKWNKVKELGEKGVEEAMNEEIVNEAVTIFVYKNGEFNNFESNYQPFNTEFDGNYLKSNNFVNQVMYKTFESQMPNAKMDSISSKQIIDGLEFYRFDINIDLPNGLKLKTVGFSRLFDKKELTINITYIDEKIGEQMLESFENSKFE